VPVSTSRLFAHPTFHTTPPNSTNFSNPPHFKLPPPPLLNRSFKQRDSSSLSLFSITATNHDSVKTNGFFACGFKASSLSRSDLKIGQQLLFSPDFANKYNENAVAIKTTRLIHVGHVVRDLAPKCRKLLALADKLGIVYGATFAGFEE